MRPVYKLAEQVAAYSSALYHMKAVELYAPKVAKFGARQLIAELRLLQLDEEDES